MPAQTVQLLKAAALVALATLMCWLAPASPAVAHDELVGVEASVSSAEQRLTLKLHFNNTLLDIGAETVVTGADGADLAAEAPQLHGREVTQLILLPDEDQVITVAWRVVSSDGHPIQGMVEVRLEAGTATATSVDVPQDVSNISATFSTSGTAPLDSSTDADTQTPSAESANGSTNPFAELPPAARITIALGAAAVVATGIVLAVRRWKSLNKE